MKIEKLKKIVKKMSDTQLRAFITNYFYDKGLMFEQLEDLGILYGNGHHMAQELAEKAMTIFEEHFKE